MDPEPTPHESRPYWEGQVNAQLGYIERSLQDTQGLLKEAHLAIKDLRLESAQNLKEVTLHLQAALERLQHERQADLLAFQAQNMQLARFWGGMAALIALVYLLGPTLLGLFLRSKP